MHILVNKRKLKVILLIKYLENSVINYIEIK